MVLRLRLALALAASLLVVAGCGASGAIGDGRLAVEPTAREQAVLHDLEDKHLDRVNALEAALVVGGPRDPAVLDAAERKLSIAIDVAVRDVDAGPTPGGVRRPTNLPAWMGMIDAPRRGRALLQALYTPHEGHALLERYDADATTLYDVATTGRYNCVSATLLYLVAAQRAGIDARAVLLPSHARAVVVTGTRHIVVETTNRDGFDPPPDVMREARDRGRAKSDDGARELYADERGTEVDFPALLAATYGNLGIMAYAHGDTEIASALVAREAALSPPEVLPLVRMQQVSMLSQLAAHKYDEGRLDEAMTFARRAADSAGDVDGRRTAEHNILAIAARQLRQHEPQLTDDQLATFAEPLRGYAMAYGDLQAVVLTFVARRKSKHGDVAGAVDALHRAAAVSISPEMRAQTRQNADRLDALLTQDRVGRSHAVP